MKNILTFIIIIIFLQSCRGPKIIQVTNYGEVTIYGKITENWQKRNGSLESGKINYYLVDADTWPDTMFNQHIKVTGKLKVTEYELDDQYQMYGASYVIKKPIIERIMDDSIIAIIDSANGDCVEMTRFIKLVQKEQLLDSLVSGARIIFVVSDSTANMLTGYDFIKKGKKGIYFRLEKSMSHMEEKEYFIISDFPCAKDSNYDFDLIYVNINGARKEITYRVTGNYKKVIIKKVR